jgi:DNA-directed RNA polymerase specialized sigma24 family protein
MVKRPDTAATQGTAVGRSLELQQAEAAALAEFADSKEAERLARLAADRDLVYELALRGYEGVSWLKFAKALAEYGFQVVRAWTSTERMFMECRRRGLGLPATERHRTRDDVLELTSETVAISLAAFREKVLIPGKWDSTRGATLKTFFIGQCVYQFPNVYRRWARETAPMRLDAMEVDETPQPPRIATLIDLRRALAALPPEDVRHLQIMVEMGHNAAEIAEITGTSKRSVESRLYRYHQTQKAKP